MQQILDAFTVFDDGIRTIWCEHSPGTAPAQNIPPGIHLHREILFVLKGNYRFPLNHKVIAPQVGDVILIDRWIAHCANYSIQDRDMLHFWVNLSGARIYMWCIQLDLYGGRKYLMTGTPLAQDMQQLLNRRWDAFAELPAQEALSHLDFYMREPLAMLLDEIRFQLVRSKRQKAGISNELHPIAAIQRIIEAENGRDCSLQRLEQIVGFNRFYLAHMFKRNTGLSIGDYINKIRLSFTEAAENRGMNRKEIAYELGFSSTSTFGNWLRKVRKRRDQAQGVVK